MAKHEKKYGEELFNELFVLEIANNHWGDINRGLRIIRDYAKVVKDNNIKAAIKLQLRDVDSFIHGDFKNQEVDSEVNSAPGTNSRYIKKTLTTKLTAKEFKTLVDEIKKQGMYAMATPFDEASVDFCEELDIDILKIASQDARAFTLIERMIQTKRPTIISNGGTGVEDLDKVVAMFDKARVPLAINHCVSLYPSEDNELEMNQVDFLRERYPKHVIGFSTHEYHSWDASTFIAYAKGARTFERHVDIEANDIPVSVYCSLPHQVDEWFKAFLKAKEMCGPEEGEAGGRAIPEKEEQYIRSVSRGAYAKRDLPKGYVIKQENLDKDFYFAIPLREGQISSREIDEDVVIPKPTKAGDPIFAGNDAGVFASVPPKTFGVLEGVLFALFFSLLFDASKLDGVGLILSAGLFVGVVLLAFGLFFAKLRGFDIFPTRESVQGSVIHGAILGYTIGTAMYLYGVENQYFLAVVLFYALGPASVLLYDYIALRFRKFTHLFVIGTLLALSAAALAFRREAFSGYEDYFVLFVIGLTIPVAHIFGEYVARTIGTARPISPWVHNFWKGVTMITLSTIALIVAPLFIDLPSYKDFVSTEAVTLLVLSGLAFVGVMFARQKTLQTGGKIITKRALAYGTMLIVAIIISIAK